MKTESTFFISADLAQVNDYTAITIIERIITKERRYSNFLGDYTTETERAYHLRHIERPERGTTYPKIVDRLKELVESEQLRDKEKAVVIDLTGVGRPVWDLMRNNGFDGKMNGIQITGGKDVTSERRIYNVPKRDLITALQVAFQNGQLKIARNLPEAETLIKELTNFKVKISVSGHDTYEAWREGIHDDIVLSAAMGVWLAGARSCRLYW